MNAEATAIHASLALAIQDAILLGHVKEIDAILSAVRDDGDFPNELRYGLEALRYFRAYYAKGGELHPHDNIQQKKVTLMESAWGAELLEMVRSNGDVTAARTA